MTAADTDALAEIKACLADPAQDWRLCGFDMEWLVAEIDRLRGTPPVGGHTIRVTLHRDTVYLTPVCHEPAEAICRSPNGCNAVTHIAAGGWIEQRCSDKTEIALYDGMPIEVQWANGKYTWSTARTSVGKL